MANVLFLGARKLLGCQRSLRCSMATRVLGQFCAFILRACLFLRGQKKRTGAPSNLLLVAAKKIPSMKISSQQDMIQVLEKRLKCGKKLFRTVLGRDCCACSSGHYNAKSDAACGFNSMTALDQILPKIRAISRKRHLA